LLKGSHLYSRGIFLMAWVTLLVCIPLFRTITRRLCAKRSGCLWLRSHRTIGAEHPDTAATIRCSSGGSHARCRG
jgi:hypothetical protein